MRASNIANRMDSSNPWNYMYMPIDVFLDLTLTFLYWQGGFIRTAWTSLTFLIIENLLSHGVLVWLIGKRLKDEEERTFEFTIYSVLRIIAEIVPRITLNLIFLVLSFETSKLWNSSIIGFSIVYSSVKLQQLTDKMRIMHVKEKQS